MKKNIYSFISIFGIGFVMGFAYMGNVHAADTATILKDCAACHGNNGASLNSGIPIIGGFSSIYMIDTAEAYKNKKRPCKEVEYPAGSGKTGTTDMCKIFNSLTDDEIADVAEYLEEQPFVSAKQEFDATQVTKGAAVHNKYCERCHSENGSYADDDSGILAGQWRLYLEETFNQFTNKTRPMTRSMTKKYNKVSAEDLEALINFYTSLQ
ncbi:MAG: c-type cytochrome [Bdellovibrionaceae bacterium]|jgi:cytochrome subunit of sulfide dehydrogenase|nr:c-type cytochrome [Pseudobdellovibrionaceae bacterium]